MGLRRLSKKKEILLSMVTHMEVGAVFSRNITDTRAPAERLCDWQVTKLCHPLVEIFPLVELTHKQTGPGLGGSDVGCVRQLFRSRLFHGVSALVYTDNLHSAIRRRLACLSAEDKKAGSALSLLGSK